jgi:sigma-B regulation protein RsbU (phosphoserine phosphatase)
VPKRGGIQLETGLNVAAFTCRRPIDHHRYDIRLEARVTYFRSMAFAFFFNGLDLPVSSPYNEPNVFGYTLGVLCNQEGPYIRLKRWENILLMNAIPEIKPGAVLDLSAEKSGGVFTFTLNGKKIVEHIDTNYRSYCLSHYPGIIVSHLPCRVRQIRLWKRKSDPAYEKCTTRYFDLRFKNFPDQIYEAEFFERRTRGNKLFDVYLHRVTDLRKAQADTRRLLTQKTKALDLLNRELKTAASVLNRLLPREFPSIPGVKFRSYYRPTGQVGGDLFDVLPVDDSRFAVFMYDVSGHGVPAALISVMTRTLFQKHFNPELTLVEQLELINHDLTKDISGTNFVTIFFGILDHKKRVLNYIGAGFMPPFLLHEKSLVLLNTRGIPLGMEKKVSSKEYSVELPPNSRLLLFTDGLYEIIDRRGEFYSWDKFMDFVTGQRDLPLDQLVDRVIAEHRKHSNPREQRDDVSLLGIEIS